MIFGSHTNNRFMDGLVDAILDNEEMLGQMDCHDFAYSRGLRTGRAMIAEIVRRKEAEKYLAKINDIINRTEAP